VTWSTLLQQQYVLTNLSGAGDTTADVLLRIPEILALQPRYVILNIARNDVANSVASATYNANYDSIASQLSAAGITVYHLLPIYETTADQTTLNTHVTSTYAAAYQINSGLSSYSAASVLADNIHPNATGHQYVYEAILRANIPYRRFTGYSPATSSLISQDQTFSPDNTYKIGASGSGRPSAIYSAGGITAAADIQAGSTNYFRWGTNSLLNSPNNGILRMRKFDGTTPVYADLPAAASGNKSSWSIISDCTSGTPGATAAGGGSVTALVVSNGTTWFVAAGL
jgi:hypothetical protein